MSHHNNAVIQGRIVFEPEIKVVSDRYTVGKFRLAFSSGKGTSYIDVDVWDKNMLELVRELSKGQEVKVQGELRSREWMNPSGEKRNKISLTAFTLEMAATGFQGSISE